MSDKTQPTDQLSDLGQVQVKGYEAKKTRGQRSVSLPCAFSQDDREPTGVLPNKLSLPLPKTKHDSEQQGKDFKVHRQRVQSLFCETEVKLPMFVARYRPSLPGDTVFRKPSLSEIHIKNERKSVKKSPGKSQNSRATPQDPLSLLRQRFQAKLTVDGPASALPHLSGVVLASLAPPPSAEEKYKRSPMKAFAKDVKHFTFIVETIERMAIEVPLPLKKLILEEASEIVEKIAKDYEKLFGFSDHLTEEANTKLENTGKALSALLKF